MEGAWAQEVLKKEEELLEVRTFLHLSIRILMIYPYSLILVRLVLM
jgi:hypothetical protein